MDTQDRRFRSRQAPPMPTSEPLPVAGPHRLTDGPKSPRRAVLDREALRARHPLATVVEPRHPGFAFPLAIRWDGFLIPPLYLSPHRDSDIHVNSVDHLRGVVMPPQQLQLALDVCDVLTHTDVWDLRDWTL